MDQRGDALRMDPRARYYIWVTCTSCGDVRIPGEATTLFARALAYRCPRCGLRDSVGVPRSEHKRLVARGFPVVALRIPAELTEAHPAIRPVTPDDLLDAHEMLARTDDIVGLLSP